MTLTQLEYALAVSKHGNFTIAAEKSNVTQPTLSMQIQKLEEELGSSIFNRNTKPIKLTAIGEKIIIQAKNILDESIKMKQLINLEKGDVNGEFTLGIIPTVMPTLLPFFLNVFTKRFPKVLLKIEELNTQSFIEQMNTDQFEKLTQFFDTMPKLSHSFKVKNPNTGIESDIVLEGLDSFLE